MKKAIPFLFCLTIYTQTIAQNQMKVIRTKNGSDFSKSIPVRDRYLYDEFHTGRIHFTNGKVTMARLNYSLLYSEIQFIDTRKDTLLLTENKFIKKIEIGSDLFYFDVKHGHIQQIESFGKVNLGINKKLVFMGNEKYAGYDSYSATSAISNRATFTNQNGEMKRLQSNEQRVMKLRTTYFFIDQNQQFYFANKGSLLKIHSKNLSEINYFLKYNQVDFSKESDLRRVLEFCKEF